jgi:hypothetical protein
VPPHPRSTSPRLGCRTGARIGDAASSLCCWTRRARECDSQPTAKNEIANWRHQGAAGRKGGRGRQGQQPTAPTVSLGHGNDELPSGKCRWERGRTAPLSRNGRFRKVAGVIVPLRIRLVIVYKERSVRTRISRSGFFSTSQVPNISHTHHHLTLSSTITYLPTPTKPPLRPSSYFTLSNGAPPSPPALYDHRRHHSRLSPISAQRS